MTEKIRQFDRHIEAVLASLTVMDCFLESPKLSIKEIIDLTGMTRNRVSRILGTLIHADYLMHTADKGVFTPGPKLMSLGKVFEANHNLVLVVRAVLRELALKTGESATFYIREGLDRVVLAREEGTNAIRFAVAVGQRLELHAGAAGKVLLAFSPEREREIIVSSMTLSSITPDTITDPQILLDELKLISSAGYSISKGERNADAFAVAAPVFERRNKLIGAIAIAGPISRLVDSTTEGEYLNELLAAAESLTKQFSATYHSMA